MKVIACEKAIQPIQLNAAHMPQLHFISNVNWFQVYLYAFIFFKT